MKRAILIIVLTILGMILATQSMAANRYIRSGASGNNSGSDWTNAMTGFPGSFVRGDTYYVADGSYGSVALDQAASGSTYIYIKKATASDHGTDTGWASSYGDGQAAFSYIAVETPYWDIDGQTGSGESGYGFAVIINSTGGANAVHLVGDPAPGNVRLKHTEVYQSRSLCELAASVSQSGFYALNPTGPIYIGYNYFHHWKKRAILLVNDDGTIIEHNFFNTSLSYPEAHGQTIQLGPGNTTNCDIRYNVFKDGHGTAFVAYLGTGHHDNIDIYGNIFWSTSAAPCGQSYLSQAVGCVSHNAASNCDIVQNTFIGMNKTNLHAQIDHNGSNGGTNNTAYNNLYYESIASFVNTANGYNTTAVSDPFNDSANGDFTLKSNTDPGTPLAAKFSKDMYGNTRTTWSRGAFEYTGEAGPTPLPDPEPDTDPIADPTGLMAYPVGLEISSVTASADDGNVPENTLDTDVNTRWSAYGTGQWIEYDLGTAKSISRADISFYLGDQRTNSFSIQVSNDRVTWQNVYTGTSSGTSVYQVTYNFSSKVSARYVRIVGNGNSVNEWNSITEVDIF